MIRKIISVRTWTDTVLDEYDIVSARVINPDGNTEDISVQDIIRDTEELTNEYYFEDSNGIKTDIEVIHPSGKYEFPYIRSSSKKQTPENLLYLPRF